MTSTQLSLRRVSHGVCGRGHTGVFGVSSLYMAGEPPIGARRAPGKTMRRRRRPWRQRPLILALVHGHVVALMLTRVDLARASDLLLLVVDHLEPLGDPAARAPDGEQDREHLHRHPQGLVDQPR